MLTYLPIPHAWMTVMNLLFAITGTVGVQLLMEVPLSALKDNIWYRKWKNRYVHSLCCSVLFMVSLIICIDAVSEKKLQVLRVVLKIFIQRYFYVANAVDAALNRAIVYLEAMLLLVIFTSYGINNVLLDNRFMSRQHPRGILIYLKYFWIASFILILLIIVLQFVFISEIYIGELGVLVLIFLPLFGFAMYNTCKYIMLKVNNTFIYKLNVLPNSFSAY